MQMLPFSLKIMLKMIVREIMYLATEASFLEKQNTGERLMLILQESLKQLYSLLCLYIGMQISCRLKQGA